MAFLILSLKQNVEEPYAIYDLEKFGVWPFRKNSLKVGTIHGQKGDITMIGLSKTIKDIGEITKIDVGWKYDFVFGNKALKGIFINDIKIPVFDNMIEFREEL